MAFDWFKRKKQNINTPTEQKKDSPKGLWHQTPTGKIIEHEELKNNNFVSPEDGFHVNGLELVVSCMDFSFIGGSLGSVMGEKISRAIDYAMKHNLPFMIICQSGGARMQEAAYSLMQLAKVQAKLAQLSDKGLPYIAYLTDPTFGGITASFAMTADIIMAEPGALIGFAGPRVIRETIGKSGDTIQIGKKNLAQLSPIIRDSIGENPDYQENRIHYSKKEDNEDVKNIPDPVLSGVISTVKRLLKSLHRAYCGLTLIPVSIIAIRASMKSATPTDIFLPCMIATFFATMAAMIIVSFKQRINLLQPIVLAYLGGISAIIALLVMFLVRLNKEELDDFRGIYKKINIFDAFIEGAKEGFYTCVKIIPYLVGILIAISLLRTSGVFDIIIDGMKYLANLSHLDTRFVDGLPTALIKPLSGSGARGMMDKDFTIRLIRQLSQALEKLLLGKPEESLMQKELNFDSLMRDIFRMNFRDVASKTSEGLIQMVEEKETKDRPDYYEMLGNLFYFHYQQENNAEYAPEQECIRNIFRQVVFLRSQSSTELIQYKKPCRGRV
ncbi:hypothetical protein FQR65_LT16992 [Abscondita terminalis]|nr:hypothetical protein FQR65_LT16992 [Abscondita terminalis]